MIKFSVNLMILLYFFSPLSDGAKAVLNEWQSLGKKGKVSDVIISGFQPHPREKNMHSKGIVMHIL